MKPSEHEVNGLEFTVLRKPTPARCIRITRTNAEAIKEFLAGTDAQVHSSFLDGNLIGVTVLIGDERLRVPVYWYLLRQPNTNDVYPIKPDALDNLYELPDTDIS